ncbi:deoxyribodipyrimidine photolyase, partial [Candidatus Saccharibacteria bacterium]|nr:deoxyribodipyrimidine photolyase [Candidatus Saccharibacteria bacterium]
MILSYDCPMTSARHLIIKASDTTQKSVVYVMSRDQRTQDNHALLAAQELAKQHETPLYVLFVLKNIPTRSREHYQFMLDGLKKVSGSLSSYGIPFVLRSGNSAQEIRDFAQEIDAGAIFFDFSPLVGARSLVQEVARTFDGLVTVVDTHNIIPAWVVSDKKEFAAHTMRGKIHKKLEEFLISPTLLEKQSFSLPSVSSLSFEDATSYIQQIPACGVTIDFTSGEKAGQAQLEKFIDDDLESYAQNRNNIAQDHQSGLSPYLHFGQISSLHVALDVINAVNHMPLLFEKPKLAEHGDQPSSVDGMNALLEEMIVRKELADNFCLYSEGYLSLKAAPNWAQKSLADHAQDMRDFIYSVDEWESATTHDTVWNATQTELTKTGKMHGYMRMYWAKKILEWSVSPAEA